MSQGVSVAQFVKENMNILFVFLSGITYNFDSRNIQTHIFKSFFKIKVEHPTLSNSYSLYFVLFHLFLPLLLFQGILTQ